MLPRSRRPPQLIEPTPPEPPAMKPPTDAVWRSRGGSASPGRMGLGLLVEVGEDDARLGDDAAADGST